MLALVLLLATAAAEARLLLGTAAQDAQAEAKAIEQLKAAKSEQEVKELLTKNNSEFLGFPGVRLWARDYYGGWGGGWGRGWGGGWGGGWGYSGWGSPAYAAYGSSWGYSPWSPVGPYYPYWP